MGTFRRRIEIASRPDLGQGGEARAALEDDFHRFRVSVRHVGGVVTEAVSEALRYPTGVCPGAGPRLAEVVGMPLAESSVAVMGRTDPRQQCTHALDLAGLAVAAAHRRTARRTYEAEVPDRIGGNTTARLFRNGVLLLVWPMLRTTIGEPSPHAGLDIVSGFTAWVRENLAPEEAEAALVLRRAVFISAGRPKEGGDRAKAAKVSAPVGGCWAWQPERREAALASRRLDLTYDFTGRPEALAGDDRLWLAFAG